jgi:uncharacterized phiE125 gp8 family phage protein
MLRSQQLTTAPTKEPLVVDDLRQHLRVDTSDEDFLLETWLVAARRHVEAYTGAAILMQTWEARLDAFPDGDEIELPRNPVQSISSIQYVDTAGATQTFAGTNYDLVAPPDPNGGSWIVALGYGKSWPPARGHIGDVRISFVAGYLERKDVPPEILSAMLLIAGDLFENREAQSADAYQPNPTARALLAPFRRRWFA